MAYCFVCIICDRIYSPGAWGQILLNKGEQIFCFSQFARIYVRISNMFLIQALQHWFIMVKSITSVMKYFMRKKLETLQWCLTSAWGRQILRSMLVRKAFFVILFARVWPSARNYQNLHTFYKILIHSSVIIQVRQ